MKLKPLSILDMEHIRKWRNKQLPMLRTSFPLTKEMQEDFYHNVVSNRNANARYWGIYRYNERIVDVISDNRINKEMLIGMAGIENIQWENRLGEISLLINRHFMEKYGENALGLILHEGFMNMNLDNIFTEVYECNPYLTFWMDMIGKYNTCFSQLPNRKYYKGEYWPSYYININKEDYFESIISKPAQTFN